MCLSYFGKIIYGILMFIILCATAVAFLTPEWRRFSIADSDKTAHVGLVYGCKFSTGSDKICTDWWNSRPKWEKAAEGLFCAAMAVEIIALAWIGWSYILCCFHKRFMHVLPLWSILVTVFLAAGIGLFYGNYKHDLGPINQYPEYTNLQPGYSATIMSGACLLAFISIFLGVATSFFADRTCC